MHEIKKLDSNIYNVKWQEIINSLLQINYNDRMDINQVFDIIQIMNSDEQKKETKNEIIDSLTILDNFLKDTFKRIDPNKELIGFNLSLQSIRESIIMGKKLRIAFIGNISVGKSTVLNCIIGKDILPILCRMYQ